MTDTITFSKSSYEIAKVYAPKVGIKITKEQPIASEVLVQFAYRDAMQLVRWGIYMALKPQVEENKPVVPVKNEKKK